MKPLIFALLSFLVAYCGQKGPLYLPPEPAEPEQAADLSSH
jgi:predicted small lipoprotein YifL